MLVFLDAAQNVKGAPNENFAREVMELFTMGVGNYTEQDIREAARAFTGWIDDDLRLRRSIRPSTIDGPKTFLGRTGNFDGVEILDIILEQKVTAEYIAGKLYRYFVREDISPAMQARLGAVLRDNDYEIAPLLRTIFLSRDFYSARPRSAPASRGRSSSSSRPIASSASSAAGHSRSLRGEPRTGQVLLNPPTVAGWAQGRAWITPGLPCWRAAISPATCCSRTSSTSSIRTSPGREIRRVNDRILPAWTSAPRPSSASPAAKRRPWQGWPARDDGQRRAPGGFQHALWQPGRLAGGGAQGQADPAGRGAVRPAAMVFAAGEDHGGRRRSPLRRCLRCRSTPRCAPR